MVLNFEDPHFKRSPGLEAVWEKLANSEEITTKDERYWCLGSDGSSKDEETKAPFPSDSTACEEQAHDSFIYHFYANDSQILPPGTLPFLKFLQLEIQDVCMRG